MHTSTTQAADIGLHIERSAYAPVLAAAPETDSISHHLFLAHTHAQPAQKAVFMFLSEALLADAQRGRQILHNLGLRRRCEHKLDYHLAGSHHSGRRRPDFESL
jgi:hypothetical protein